MQLSAHDFPPGTPLHHFFLWNERRWWRDRRYKRMRDRASLPGEIAEPLTAAIGNPDVAAHAAAFAAFEARTQPPRRILVIRLSAFGDFVQSLGPFSAIHRQHRGARITLLTTQPFAAFAAELGYFDAIIIDERPRDVAGSLRLRRRLRAGEFDRIYDLQTAQRSNRYALLMRPGLPQWSGIAWGCSHPHANLARDAQHTLDRQAEQLLMAGIYPTPLPGFPPFDRALPQAPAGREFVLLAPGSSPLRPAKRWPVDRFGAVAQALAADDYLPVIIGTAGEAALAEAIRAACPAALDLVGQTDLAMLACLARNSRLTIGNDSGACHLAAAAECPVIVLFSGESDPARCAPRGRAPVQVLMQPDLVDLPAERVIRAARSLLVSPSWPGVTRPSTAGSDGISVAARITPGLAPGAGHDR
jgi:ADP-heptose:LPS heptosyltransferase